MDFEAACVREYTDIPRCAYRLLLAWRDGCLLALLLGMAETDLGYLQKGDGPPWGNGRRWFLRHALRSSPYRLGR